MKLKNIFSAFLLVLPIFFGSCKKSLPVAYSGQQYLEFSWVNDVQQVTTAYSSFYYLDQAKNTDTVWFRVRTLGSVPGKTAYLKFSAFTDPKSSSVFPDAVAGVQYVSFDDEGVRKLMKVEAGKYEALVPVVLKRDPSLKNKVYQLRFKIGISDDFAPGSSKHTEGIVYISDKLSQPSNWTTNFFLGSYGEVKHKFIIEQSGQRWDTDFIQTLTVPVDLNTQSFYLFKFTQALKNLNADRKAQGLTELREDPALPSTAVTFPNL
jgi:hypothetical protein